MTDEQTTRATKLKARLVILQSEAAERRNAGRHVPVDLLAEIEQLERPLEWEAAT